MKPNRIYLILALCVALPLVVSAQQYAPGISIVEDNSADQNEPSVAIDRTNPARVMLVWQDSRQANTCLPGYALSSDGGVTWFRRDLIGNLINNYGSNNSCAFGKNNTIYVTSLGKNDQGYADLGAIWLSISTDLGQNWQNPIRVSEQEMNQDRPYMCVYDAPNLQHPIIHVAWWEGPWGTDYSVIRYARTTDNGQTWLRREVELVYYNEYTGEVVAYPTLAVDQTGDRVNVVWLDHVGDGAAGHVRVGSSTDGGTNFPYWTQVSVPAVSLSNVGTARAWSTPTITVEPTTGYVYVAWTQKAGSGFEIYYARSTDGGGTFSTPAKATPVSSNGFQFMPWLTADAMGTVSLVYYQGSATSLGVYVAQRFGSGSSFEASVMRINDAGDPNDVADLTKRFDYINVASASGGNLIPAWTDFGAAHTSADIYAATYNTLTKLAFENKSWSSQSTSFNGQRKLYRESSGKLHEVFASGTITAGEIFYRNSTDNGSTWNVTARLSDGTGTSLAPCITMGAGSPFTVIVVWQQTNGSNYNVVFSRSTNGGSSWSSITSLESNFSCASPGPLPSVSANILTGSALVVYRTSFDLKYVYSTSSMLSWYGPYTVPSTNGNYNSPTTAFYPIPSPMADKSNLSFSAGVGYSSRLYYGYYWIDNSWSSFTDLSNALPGNYVEHKDPSLAVSSTSTSTVHIAWEATLIGPPTPVIVHRKGSSGIFGSQYNVIQRQYINNPSITGVTSDNAWMVFQNPSSGVFSRIQYFYSGGSWIWSNLTDLYSGNYAQLSVGSSSAKYLWTAGISSPYTIAIGGENLSKADMLAVSYSRELNFIDSKEGSSISVEMKQPQIVQDDGTLTLIPFVDPPPDSVTIVTKEIMKNGNTQSFTPPSDMDTLKLQYSVRTINSENMLQGGNAVLSFDLYDVNTGKVLKNIDRRAIVKSSDTTSDLYQISTSAGDIQDLPEGSEISIRPSVTGAREDSPGMIASLGHIYRYETEGVSQLQRGAIAEKIRPKEYLLEQNYPNPFNPVTQIKYSILEDGHITLKVFDVLGREVAVLVNGLRGAGVYTSEWNSGNCASGVYLARLIVRNGIGNLKYHGVKKLLLAK